MIINIFWPENMGRVVAAVLSLPYLCILVVWASHEKISESIPNSNDSKPNDIYTQWRHKADRARASLGIWLTILAWCYNKKKTRKQIQIIMDYGRFCLCSISGRMMRNRIKLGQPTVAYPSKAATKAGTCTFPKYNPDLPKSQTCERWSGCKRYLPGTKNQT